MIADLCVLGIIVLFIYFGYRAGLVRSCVNVAAFGVSIFVSLMIYPVISAYMLSTPIYTSLSDFISNNVSGTELSGMLDYIPSFGVNTGQLLATGIAGGIATLIINIVSFALVVIFCRLGLLIVTRILDLIAKLPVIRTFNRLGGSVLGGLTGIAVVYIVLALAVAVLPVDSAGTVMNEIRDSKVASQMYDNNILLSLISKGE